MQHIEDLPEAVKKSHHSLEPFIKQRQKVSQIRRVLALHLSSHISSQEGSPISTPLSLLDATSDVGPASNGVRGIRREYLRCVRANINARQEYEKIRRQHQLHIRPEKHHLRRGSRDDSKEEGSPEISLDHFLDVVKYRRKHERLRILQDYLDMLAQKPAAAADHLDPRVVLKDVGSLPPVPTEVMINTGVPKESKRTDLNELVDQLEKSVLRAKMLLKKEQKLLAKVKADGQPRNASSTNSGSRLQALGTARNELINWIETELAKAGESADSGNDQASKSVEKKGKDYIDSQLISINRQYSQYTKARQSLILAATGSLEAPPPTAIQKDPEVSTGNEEVDTASTMSYVLHPYLAELMCVSNEQKSMIQQKSHITISLAKQLKEAGQGLDRLAEESHLLPSYPFTSVSTQRKGLEGPASLEDEISNLEKPDSSRRVRAWVFASDSSSKNTKDTVLGKLEEGEVAILEARQTLSKLQALLGEDVDAGIGNQTASVSRLEKSNIWASLDGHLGVLTRDDDNEA